MQSLTITFSSLCVCLCVSVVWQHETAAVDLQVQWYELEQAAAYQRAGDYGHAPRKFHQIEKVRSLLLICSFVNNLFAF